MSPSTESRFQIVLGRAKSLFAPRTFLFHNGTALRRVRLGTKTQASFATLAVAVVSFAGYGVANASVDMAQAAGVTTADSDVRVAMMEQRVATLQGRVRAIRDTAQARADRVEQRQAMLAAAMTGADPKGEFALALAKFEAPNDKLARFAIGPIEQLEQRQAVFARAAVEELDARYDNAVKEIRQRGLRADRIVKSTSSAMGGPLIDPSSSEATADLKADQQFRTLFTAWKKLDTLEQGAIAIPSVQPVEKLQFTSNFGIRSDPFRGTAAMHAGVDIPGPIGTPIYATADGIVSTAGRQGGYGNLVEINHGKGIATRYGHLSKIIVADNTRVHRGQIIGLMGSTGRSTGSHLHYEVRIDGHAVNPLPFLTTADYLLAAQDRAVRTIPVSTDGPAPQD